MHPENTLRYSEVDFTRLAKAYAKCNWKWAFPDETNRVPKASELWEKLQNLVTPQTVTLASTGESFAAPSHEHPISTGGLSTDGELVWFEDERLDAAYFAGIDDTR